MNQSKARLLIADIERHLPQLDAGDEKPRNEAIAGTRVAWASLVKTLDLGPEPLTRSCPKCRGEIMRAATRCIHCWAKSAPPIN